MAGENSKINGFLNKSYSKKTPTFGPPSCFAIIELLIFLHGLRASKVVYKGLGPLHH